MTAWFVFMHVYGYVRDALQNAVIFLLLVIVWQKFDYIACHITKTKFEMWLESESNKKDLLSQVLFHIEEWIKQQNGNLADRFVDLILYKGLVFFFNFVQIHRCSYIQDQLV